VRQLLTISFEDAPAAAWSGRFQDVLVASPFRDAIEVAPEGATEGGLAAAKKSELAVWIGAGSTAIMAVLSVAQTMSTQMHAQHGVPGSQEIHVDVYGDHDDVHLVIGPGAPVSKEQVEKLMKQTGPVRSVHCSRHPPKHRK
jgi:hypothetical protein